MNILLTNDDGYDAPGLAAAFDAIKPLGRVHVVAPASQQSACSHAISLYGPIRVDRIEHERLGLVHAVAGTPADCVRLAVAELLDVPIDLVISGINQGANTGVDTFYSGTIAGAREGTILGIPAIAVSHAVRGEVRIDWKAASPVAEKLIRQLMDEPLPGQGFWSINFPAVLTPDAPVQRVPVALETVPLDFERSLHPDSGVLQFHYGKSYWSRDVSEPSDFSVVRDGAIAVTAVPLFGRF